MVGTERRERVEQKSEHVQEKSKRTQERLEEHLLQQEEQRGGWTSAEPT